MTVNVTPNARADSLWADRSGALGFVGCGLWGVAEILFFTYLQYPAARLQTGIVHTGLVHAQRDAVQQDDQNGDALKPRARVQSRVKQLRKHTQKC